MCTNPIHIKNKKIEANTFLHGADKPSLVVPCGHCAQCRQRKIDDLTFRGFYEYLETKRQRGFTLIQTLTYSEQHVPYDQGFRYFRKSDAQKFLKRLRINLKRSGYDVDGKLKYVITFEYGHKRHRPHMHVLFFVTFAISPERFDYFVRYCWTHLGDDDSRVPLGRLDPQQTYKRIVNSIYGIRYVCKYIGKGTNVVEAIKASYAQRSHLNEFVFNWCTFNDVKYDNLQDWQLSKIWKCYKEANPSFPDDMQLLPTLLQSQNLGMSFLQDCSYEDLFDVVNISNRSPKGYKSYAIPMYYLRKVFYDYDKDSKRFILNSLGRDLVSHNNDVNIKRLNELVNVKNEVVDRMCSEVSNGKYNTVSSMVDSILQHRSFDDFILYSVYLHGREISPLFHFLDFESLDVRSMVNIQNELELDCHVSDSCLYEVKRFSTLFNDFVVSDYQIGDLPHYDMLPQFVGFLELHEYLSAINQKFAEFVGNKIALDFEKEENESKVKAQFSDNCLIY